MIAGRGQLLLALLLAGCSARSAGSAALDGGPPGSCSFTPRFGLAAASFEGAIYAIGGSNGSPLSLVERLGAVGGSQAPAPLPAPATWLAAATTAAGLFVLGGDGEGPGDGLATAVRLDPTSGAWSDLPILPGNAWALAASATTDGTVFALGGLLGHSVAPQGTVWRLAPNASGWTAGSPMPTARYFLAAVAGVDGRLFALGGCSFGCGAVFPLLEAYSPTTDSWSTLARMPTPRAQLAAVLGPDGRLYALGGMDANGEPLATAEIYDPAQDAWTSIAPLPTARSNLAAALGADGRIYALGGRNAAFQPLGTVEVYNPATGSWATQGCDAADAGTPTPATFAQLDQRLFQAQGCTMFGCHGAGAGPAVGGLDLVTDPYTALLGTGSGAPAANSQGQLRGLLRVKPGDPSHSLLWIKLQMSAGDYATYGQDMPFSGGNLVPASVLEGLEGWIEAGAPR